MVKGNQLDNGNPVNGDTDFEVYKSPDRSETWTDIDIVRDGTFVEDKVAGQMPDPATWIANHVTAKMVKLRGARAALGPDFANVPFVYQLGGQNVSAAVRAQVEAAAFAEGVSQVIWRFPAP